MIKVVPPTFWVTPYGDVDADALDALRNTYDTTAFLALVDSIDGLRSLFAAKGGVRDDFLRLHAMAHTVINGAPQVVVPEEADIWEAAQQLIDTLSETANVLQAAVEALRPLATLAPARL